MPNVKQGTKSFMVLYIKDITQLERHLATVLDVRIHGRVEEKEIVGVIPGSVRLQIAKDLVGLLREHEVQPSVMKCEVGCSIADARAALRDARRKVS